MISLICITTILLVTNPLFNLDIIQSNTQIVNGTVTSLNNGFVGSNYISYKVLSNSTESQVTVSSFSLSSLMIVILSFLWLIITIFDNVKFNIEIKRKDDVK